MTDFLLLASRRLEPRELSPVAAARECAAGAGWHRALRGWGLARAFALRSSTQVRPSLCLVVRSSGPAAARRLADGWERVAAYDVTVLPLVDLPRP